MKKDDTPCCFLLGRQDGRSSEGVGLALIPQAQAALCHPQGISARIYTDRVEFLMQTGLLMIVTEWFSEANCFHCQWESNQGCPRIL